MFYSGKKDKGKITSIESKSVDKLSNGFKRITEKEYTTFIASLPIMERPPQEKQIDPKKLKQVLISKGIITNKSEIEIG